ncbi:copper chaperone PCu(A)C [Phenylobacterium sp. LjRoot225]|uniref:copper chaperone PCu(A)C n=1 Tax=Phenylobacterium sp. LjRoot225 TaxID=3342285 RepID=UPI003ECDFBE4
MKAALAALALFAAGAQPVAALAASIEAVQPWSRPAAAGTTGAGYMTLVNHGKADALIGAETPLAQKVEMHTSTMAGGVMGMVQETRVPLAASGAVSFAPGGRHLMFVGLKRALRVGDLVPATLSFASGEKLKVDFIVGTSAATMPMEHADHMNMPGM